MESNSVRVAPPTSGLGHARMAISACDHHFGAAVRDVRKQHIGGVDSSGNCPERGMNSMACEMPNDVGAARRIVVELAIRDGDDLDRFGPLKDRNGVSQGARGGRARVRMSQGDSSGPSYG